MTLWQQLAARLRGRVAVIGIGNPLRGDDAAGCSVVDRLRPSAELRVFRGEEVPESLLGPVSAARPETVILIDAVDLGAEPGAVALLEPRQLLGYVPTTHRLPLSLLAQHIARETGAREIFLLAIQPGRLAFGPMSPEVERSAELLACVLDAAAAERGAREAAR